MLRADNIVCGTSTTGTGTLTLAACPAPPGGIDFDVWARTTGIGFANSAALLVSYTIIEYTDSNFTTASKTEKGIGTLTLGGSSGIANCTLARTTVQSTATSMNSTASLDVTAPTAISIGTAANTLVFIGPSVCDVMPSLGPYYDSTDASTAGLSPVGFDVATGSFNLQNGVVIYIPFFWAVPMLAKTFTCRTGNAAYTGGTSNAYAAIYATNTSGKPGKLLIDFGVLGTAGSSLSATFTNIASAAHTNGYFLTPGLYWAAIFTAFSGGSGTPTINASDEQGLGHSVWGLTSGGSENRRAEATATANPAPDPATTTSYFVYTSSSSPGYYPYFWLKP